MDHHWHLRPVQGNICPTCSISHFPHCPPLPSFNPNPRYPSTHDYSLQRPGFDPYIGSTSSVPYHPNSEYRDPNLGHRNPNFDRNLQGHGAYPSRVSYDHSYSNGFINGVDRNNKRIRVDEMGSGAFVNEFHGNLSRVVSEEDERRLKLIRDHGCALGGPSQNGLNPTLGAGSGFNHESAVSEKRYGDIGIWEHGNFDDLRGGRGENALKLPGGYSSREDRSLGFGQQSMQSNRSGPNDIGDRYYSASQKADLNRQGLVPRSGDYLIGEFPNENYGSQNIEQLQPKEFMSGALYNEQRSSLPMENRGSNNQPLQSREGNLFPVGHQSFHVTAQHVPPNINNQASYSPLPTGGSMVSENPSQMHASRVYNAQPPLPSSPPPPPPMEPPGNTSSELKASYFPPKTSPSLLPVHNKDTHSVSPSSYPPVLEAHYMSQPYFQNGTHSPASIGFTAETWSRQYMGEGQLFPPKHISSDDRKLIDGSQLFKQPHRSARPDHIVIILRGLPGSGKSYLAKMLRDLEVENGGDAPRIHSMDDYFMTEVEKVDESEMSKSTSSGRGKKPIMKKVMEYCYEPEMEEAYRSSMLKAFKKTLEEGVFTFIIVDDRNLRVADFAQFWAIAKRSGYEVYLLEASYKDPVGCAARNVHGFTQEEIQTMAGQWEEAPSFYLQLDIKSLFHGDDLKDNGIQEVDMDMEDRNIDEGLSGSPICKPEIAAASSTGDRDHATAGSSKDLESWGADIAEGDHSIEEVKELGRSKWSEDLDEDDGVRTEGAKVFKNSLSGLVQAYGKEAKSVQWGDKAGNTGFAIGAAKKAKVMSLVIGPGAGYNLKSNPLGEEENSTSQQSVELKRRSVFEERLRAEHESFKAIFDRRRHRIGLDADEDS